MNYYCNKEIQKIAFFFLESLFNNPKILCVALLQKRMFCWTFILRETLTRQQRGKLRINFMLILLLKPVLLSAVQ